MKLNKLFVLVLFVFQSCASIISDNSIDIDTSKLNQDSTTDYQVKVGEKISFKTSVHGSVGMAAEYKIVDEKILKLEEAKIIYDNPNFEGTGGDGGKKKFTFKGLSKGKTKVTIQKIYRGDLEKEIVLEIEVI
jgi:hypothetical protein